MTAPALVALAHGSRDPRSAATIKALVARGPPDAPRPAHRAGVPRALRAVVRHGRRPAGQGRLRRDRRRTAAAHRGLPRQGRRADRDRARPPTRHPGLQIRATERPRPRDDVPRRARPPAARGPAATARVRELDALVLAAAGSVGPARQPGRRPAGPGLGRPAQAAGHRGVRLGRSPGHRRGGPRVPRARAVATSPSARCSSRRASCPTGPPSSPSRPVPSRCPSRSAPTPSWPARSWRATPSAPSSWSPSPV